MDFPEYFDLKSPIIEEVLEESQEANVRETVFILCLFAKYVIPKLFERIAYLRIQVLSIIIQQ